MNKYNVQYATAFSGADAVASCISQHQKKFGHWKQAWSAELKPEHIKREDFSDAKDYRAALNNAEWACSVLTERSPLVPNLGDICKVVDNKLAAKYKTDVLIMGPPCQDYSQAGLGKGIEGNVAPLSMDAVIAAQTVEPWVVIIENANEWRTIHEEYFNLVMDRLKTTHRVAETILDPKMFNVPYNRKRLYVVAVRHGQEAQLEQIVSDWPVLPKHFDRSNVDWSKFLEPIAKLKALGRLKQRRRGAKGERDLLLTADQARTLITTRIKSKGKFSGPVGKRVEELRHLDPSEWKLKEEDRKDLDLFIETFENAGDYFEGAEVEDMDNPMFWANEYGTKMPKEGMTTLMKSGPNDRGIFFWADEELKPRLLCANEWEWAQGFQGWWTKKVPNIFKKGTPDLREADRKGLMGNSMSIPCLQFLIDRIDRAMQPVWQEIAGD